MAEIKGGEKLEAALREIAAKLGNGGTLAVGFLENATYPDGTPVAMVAAIQDFGAPGKNIPPRPFFRNMVAAKSPDWPDAIATNLRARHYDSHAALENVGMGIKGQLQQSITETSSPPLSPKTIAAKGFDKPLIDTGHMQNSVDFKVT